MALQAAYRRAIEREKEIGGDILGKFIRIREALIFEREFDRAIFEDVAYRLRPQAMPAHKLFTYPESRADNVGIVKGLIGTMCFQLSQPRVKTYRTISSETKAVLGEVLDLLGQDRRREIIERDLFGQAYRLLVNELASRQNIYPQPAS